MILLYITVFILADLGLNFMLKIAFITLWAILFSIFALPPNYYLLGYEKKIIPAPRRFKLASVVSLITPAITVVFSYLVANYFKRSLL